ncbi:AAA-like domain-containing protein [Nostoc sp. FACHB-152]|uniref:AAA-like domain-containing protein n=1 Tax=unclassified Nostoc TaxID=2593658 RepID=UPI001685C08D|nr:MULTISPECIES: AAA-like domain-containing protein [unclassified Nostoc]MBD2447892.1 AAA-like domain-containing protein [Nostoc sp. FACHB-152]MBD2468534.1 AAA-like domain-containing protein [Nostoc sp. FACHB-145]
MDRANQGSFYQIEAGTLPLNAPTYVERKADEKLRQFACSTQTINRVCYILAARQMGKSSLMVRMTKHLANCGAVGVKIYLQQLGNVESEKALWFNLLRLICQQVVLREGNLVSNLDAFWDKNPGIQPTVQFEEFLIQEVLSKIDKKKLIIFIDEIQTLTDWNLQNSFIGFLKNLSENRDQVPLQRLNFVLIGVAKPSDLITSNSYSFNLGDYIELGGLLKKDCQPLLQGLNKVTREPDKVLELLLDWTGGQPFLTQVLCHLIATEAQIPNNYNLKDYVERVVTDKITNDWKLQDRQSHLQEIENWFIRVTDSYKHEKLKAIRLYKKILNQDIVHFNERDTVQWDLLISGLVTKNNGYLKVTNRIYERVFNLNWIHNQEKKLQEHNMVDPLSTIYNRDVFILIDQSGSMTKQDAADSNLKRWDSLKEIVMSHVDMILSEKNSQQEKICDSIYLDLFSRSKLRREPHQIKKATQVENIFLENRPDTSTFVVPALKRAINYWFDSRVQSKTQGAFFIIYTDGQFDDTKAFEALIEDTCKQIYNERVIKIIVVGIGKDIDVEYFQSLNNNLQGNVDKNGNPCDIFVFELETEMEDIIELMEREIN